MRVWDEYKRLIEYALATGEASKLGLKANRCRNGCSMTLDKWIAISPFPARRRKVRSLVTTTSVGSIWWHRYQDSRCRFHDVDGV